MSDHARLDYIHGLRGFAAAMVVLQHAAQLTHNAGSSLFDPMLFSLNLGRFGVTLFFLISGFVIPFSFKGPQPLRSFWIGRLFRLFPAYWLSIPLMIFLLSVRGFTTDTATVIANLTMLQNAIGFTNLGMGYWTLNYEMGFYLLCTLLAAVRRLHDTALIGVLIIAGIATSVGSHLQRDLMGQGFAIDFPYFVAMFFLGLLLRRAMLDRDPDAVRWSMAMVPATVFSAFLMGGMFFPVEANRVLYFPPLVLSLSMALPPIVFIAVLKWRPVMPAPMLWLGTISYSLYLFQDLWLIMLPKWLSPGAYPLSFVVLTCVLSTVTAAIIYAVVEKPMLALGRKVMRRRAASAPVAPAAA